jgi:hypothetical protein
MNVIVVCLLAELARIGSWQIRILSGVINLESDCASGRHLYTRCTVFRMLHRDINLDRPNYSS